MKYVVTLKDKTYEVEVEEGEAMILDEYEAKAPPPLPRLPQPRLLPLRLPRPPLPPHLRSPLRAPRWRLRFRATCCPSR